MKIRKIVVVALAVVALSSMGYGLTFWFLSQQSDSDQNDVLFKQTPVQPLQDGVVSNQSHEVGDRLAPSSSSNQSGGFDPRFSELEWDSLMPADWDPMAAFRSINIAGLQDNDPKAQEALEKMRKAWNNAPVNPELNGNKVRIPGFVIPIEQGDKGVDEFLLVPYFGACIHTPPPPANQIIHVKLSDPEPSMGAMQAYWVWGELTSSKFSTELGDSAYLLKAAGLRPYGK
jgi:hypothetical protein